MSQQAAQFGATGSQSQSDLAMTLSGRKSRQGSERIIQGVLLACGVLSVLTTIGIIIILFEQAIEFFREVSKRSE